MQLPIETPETAHITISLNNMKMGPSIPSFSTPSVLSCPKGLPCYQACYARAFEEKRGTVHRSYCNNMQMMLQYPQAVEDRIVGFINGMGTKFFRFNVSGDVVVDALRPYLYINLIKGCAMRCKGCRFLCFSKSALWNNVEIESNLNVPYSSWGEWKVDNPKGFKTTNVIPKPKKKEPYPTDKFICPNCLDKRIKCENCHHCWGVKFFDYWKFLGIDMPDKVKEYYDNLNPTDPNCTYFTAHGIHKNQL